MISTVQHERQAKQGVQLEQTVGGTRGNLARLWRAVTSVVKVLSQTTMGRKGRKMRGKHEKGNRVEVSVLSNRENHLSGGKI